MSKRKSPVCVVMWSLDGSGVCKCERLAVGTATVIAGWGRGNRFRICERHAEKVVREADMATRWSFQPDAG